MLRALNNQYELCISSNRIVHCLRPLASDNGPYPSFTWKTWPCGSVLLLRTHRRWADRGIKNVPCNRQRRFEQRVDTGHTHIDHTIQQCQPAEPSQNTQVEEGAEETQKSRSAPVYHKHDLEYDYDTWVEILEHHERIYGHKGVQQVWQRMQSRGVSLPLSGPCADQLWIPLFSAAARDKPFREEIWLYARAVSATTNNHWHGFASAYLSIILDQEPETAFDWFKQLQAYQFTNELSLRRLVAPAVISSRALDAFKEIYEHHSERKLYDRIVPILVGRGLIAEAFSWHEMLVGHGDLPTTQEGVEQLVARITKTSERSSIMRNFKGNGTCDVNTFPHIVNANAPRSGSLAKGDDKIYGFDGSPIDKRRPISDHFAARAFATEAFSIHLIISGLLSFGFDRMGALSIRELAVRCSASVSNLKQHLTKLEENGVVLDDKVFTQVVKKIAFDENQHMLEVVLENDQHPDVYDDEALQNKLLVHYVAEADWEQVNRTLTILTIFHQKAPQEAWNTVLREFMKAKNWKMGDLVLNDMLAQRIPVTIKSMKDTYFALVPRRRHGHRASQSFSTSEFDGLAYFTGALLKILRYQGSVPVLFWKGILVSHGMEGRLMELESLCVTLADLYTRKKVSPARRQYPSNKLLDYQSRRVKRLSRDITIVTLSQLFSGAMQRAIVEWGFISLGLPSLKPRRGVYDFSSREHGQGCRKSLSPESPKWDYGLRLLRRLQRRGLCIDHVAVRKACRTRLTILFGPGFSSRRANRVAVERNVLTMRQMIMQIHKIMGSNILMLPTRVLQNE